MLNWQKYETSHGRMCGASFERFSRRMNNWQFLCKCTVFLSGARAICSKCGILFDYGVEYDNDSA